MQSEVKTSVIDAAGDSLAVWAIWTLRMRDIVRRSYAYIDGRVLLAEVVYHCPEALR